MSIQEELAARGIELANGQQLLDCDKNGRVTMDAALSTVANTTIPNFFTTYIHPGVIEVVAAKRTADVLFPRLKCGDFEDDQYTYAQSEPIGQSTAYSDFGHGTTSDVNDTWETREIYVHQTFIQVGDREMKRAGRALIDLMAQKQRAAAETLAIMQNKCYWSGVEGRKIYGILNDPSLNAAINATSQWNKQDALAIYNDVLKMFKEIVEKSGGHVDVRSRFCLAVPPAVYMDLMKVTTLGVSPTMELLTKNFPNIRIESCPELVVGGVNKAMLFAEDIAGQAAGECAMIVETRAGQVIPNHSSISQKWVAANGGFKLNLPYAICMMTGV